jgi:hypothetical protein
MWNAHSRQRPSAVRGLLAALLSHFARGSVMRTKITILVDPAYAGKVESIVEKLQATGLAVDRVMPRIRVITGSADTRLIDSIKKLPEVKSVERTGEIYIEPLQSRASGSSIG